jgi:hypothetical protein
MRPRIILCPQIGLSGLQSLEGFGRVLLKRSSAPLTVLSPRSAPSLREGLALEGKGKLPRFPPPKKYQQ